MDLNAFRDLSSTDLDRYRNPSLREVATLSGSDQIGKTRKEVQRPYPKRICARPEPFDAEHSILIAQDGY